ncbi:spermidine synthase [Aequorivita capsosiphonis]|uniref:spermidine synthase n=1 Tax=Aequorivita capsosiphonis TaxID=487317 RepID=UPI00041B7D2C|nr:fused MFS/spermidine synthase [Aequorivita capsosiphonis]
MSKKFLSYIWPITRRFSSEVNGTLEVTYVNGKKILDTENANYSYGSLQKILEIGLTKVDLKSVENLLILGMGGGSVIKSLRETFEYQENIVTVEIDPEIIKLAKDEFGISTSENLQIIQEDAFEYVKTSDLSAGAEERFQLIIIDLFIDINVPPIFYEKEFCDNVSSLLQKNGFIIFNVGLNLEKKSNIVETIISNFGNGFQFEILSKVNRTNTLLIAQKLMS